MKVGFFVEALAGTRVERWLKSREILAFYFDGEGYEPIVPRATADSEQGITIGTFVEGARELIFDTSGERPLFHIVTYLLDRETNHLSVAAGLQLLIDGETPDALDEQIVYILGLALADEVPVYPNRDEDAPILARHYRELITHGMLAPDESGKKVRLKWTRVSADNVTTFSYFDELKLTDMHPPAELALIREAVREELAKRDEAGRVLASLRLAIDELNTLLLLDKRNEHALQKCLTLNPILFGPDYQRVIPKHALGAEYEMDYALIRASGLVDLVEIESSTLKLFNQKGNPTADLVHAEQQVLNWLQWVEDNESYARRKLANLMRPVGYVIIGRSAGLSDPQRRRLNMRNVAFGGAVQILTYDDLLARARNLLAVLEGMAVRSG